VLLAVAAVLLTACTTVVEGSPSAPSGVLLPPRPREVRLDGVDPCSLLTPEQRAGLGLDSEPRPTRSYVELFRGNVPSCTMIGLEPAAVGIGVSAVTSVGIERWQEGDLAANIQPTRVSGFPALIATPARYTTYCNVEVDVAAGQLLDVQFSDGGNHPSIPQADLCRRGQQAAEAVMATLLAR
jgi:Protein of unknown function (DUF3558)